MRLCSCWDTKWPKSTVEIKITKQSSSNRIILKACLIAKACVFKDSRAWAGRPVQTRGPDKAAGAVYPEVEKKQVKSSARTGRPSFSSVCLKCAASLSQWLL